MKDLTQHGVPLVKAMNPDASRQPMLFYCYMGKLLVIVVALFSKGGCSIGSGSLLEPLFCLVCVMCSVHLDSHMQCHGGLVFSGCVARTFLVCNKPCKGLRVGLRDVRTQADLLFFLRLLYTGQAG